MDKMQGIEKIHTATAGRTGGVYIPPFKMRMLEKSISDKASTEYQRLTWDALKKSLNGLVNKVSQKNVAKIIPEIFSLIEDRGRFSIIGTYLRLAATNPVSGHLQQGCTWFDLGKPEQLDAVASFLELHPELTIMP